MIIRKAKINDVKNLIKLDKELHKESMKLVLPEFKVFDVYRNQKEYFDYVKQKKFLLLLVEEDSKMIGFISGKIEKIILNKHKVMQGKISDIYVKKVYRSKKIASMLYESLFAWFKKNKCNYVELNVYPNNPAKKIYSHWGFKEMKINM